MSTYSDPPLAEHVIVNEPDRPRPDDPEPGANAWRIPGMLDKARRLEQRRRLADAERKLDTLAARVAELEPEPVAPAADIEPPPTVIPADERRTPLAPGDSQWLIGRWREEGWPDT